MNIEYSWSRPHFGISHMSPRRPEFIGASVTYYGDHTVARIARSFSDVQEKWFRGENHTEDAKNWVESEAGYAGPVTYVAVAYADGRSQNITVSNSESDTEYESSGYVFPDHIKDGKVYIEEWHNGKMLSRRKTRG